MTAQGRFTIIHVDVSGRELEIRRCASSAPMSHPAAGKFVLAGL